MNYWLDLFTGTTWDEFQKSGASISGFSHRMRKTVQKIQPGDILLCYLTGVMRWVGALEVIGQTDDKTPIWKDAEFPSRLKVKPLLMRIDSKRKLPWEGGNGLREPYVDSKRVLPSYAPENESNYPTGSAGFEAYALRPGRQGTQNQNHQRT